MKKYGNRFCDAELKARAFRRTAQVLYEIWEEGGIAHTRLFDTLIWQKYYFVGTSTQGAEHKEHVVPCAYIRDLVAELFDQGESVEKAAQVIEKLLKVVAISREERRHLDFETGLKTTMPEGWLYETDSVFARLEVAGIEFKEEPVKLSTCEGETPAN